MTMTPIGFFKGVPAAVPVTITFAGSASDVANATNYSFSSVAIGTASSDRIVIVGVVLSSASAGAPRTTSSVTVGGISATKIVERVNTDRESVSIWAAQVPTGTTATIAVNTSGSEGRAGVITWAMTGKSSVAAFATAFDSNTSSDPNATIDIPANGAAVAVATVGQNTSTTWTGLTERHDSSVESVSVQTGASDNFASAQTALSVTANFATNGQNSMVIASWGP